MASSVSYVMYPFISGAKSFQACLFCLAFGNLKIKRARVWDWKTATNHQGVGLGPIDVDS